MTNSTEEKEKLARQIIRIMGHDPDQEIHLPSGEVTVLWRVAVKAMSKLPLASLRTHLDSLRLGPSRARPPMLLKLHQQLHRGWTKPKYMLPPRVFAGVTSEPVIVLLEDGSERPAELLYGTPVGSHRWVMLDTEEGEHEFRHVLDVAGWKYPTKDSK